MYICILFVVTFSFILLHVFFSPSISIYNLSLYKAVHILFLSFLFLLFLFTPLSCPPFLFPASISFDGAILISFFLSFAADTTNVKRGMYRHVIYSLNISIAFSTLKLLFSRLNSQATGSKRHLYFICF